MLFIEPRFAGFLALVLVVHWALRSHRHRKLFLLAASYAFYAGWNWKFLSLIFLSTVIDFTVGLRLGSEERVPWRKRWLAVSVVANLGFLAFFKYYNFFADSAADFLRWLGFQPNDLTLRIVLPVGISFYTFQTMSYTIDVYRRNLEPVRRFSDFALFVAFFPQLVAGPIVRAITFLPQLGANRVWRRDSCGAGVPDAVPRGLLQEGVPRGQRRGRRGQGLRGPRCVLDPQYVDLPGALPHPGLRRLLRLQRHGHRLRRAPGVPPHRELQLPLLRAEHRRVLAPLAHQPGELAEGLPLRAARRQLGGAAETHPQHLRHDGSVRAVARRGMEVRDVRRAARGRTSRSTARGSTRSRPRAPWAC